MKNVFDICFIDSGVGGVSVLCECKKIINGKNILYVADNEFSPYGNKTNKELNARLNYLVQKIFNKYNITVFVLACNTATAVCINSLRQNFPDITFVGIEPAIKPAYKNGGNTLVLSTVATFNNSKLCKSYLDKDNIYFAPQKNLAKEIDNNLNNLWNIYTELERKLNKFKKLNIKNIVLGCTHYCFIKSQLEKIFPNVSFWESNYGVAKRLKSVLGQNNNNNENKKNKIKFITTKQDLSFKKKIIDLYNIDKNQIIK